MSAYAGRYQAELRGIPGYALIGATVKVYEADTDTLATLYNASVLIAEADAGDELVNDGSTGLAASAGPGEPGVDTEANVTFFADSDAQLDIEVVWGGTALPRFRVKPDPDGRIGPGDITEAMVSAGVATQAELDLAVSTRVANTRTADYTLVLADAGKAVEVNAATGKNVTVPPNSAVAFAVGTIIEVPQVGAGVATVLAGVGVTITGDTVTPGQGGSLLLRKTGTNAWWSAIWSVRSGTYAVPGVDGAVWQALPNLAAAVRLQNDASPTTLRVISLGSSVGVGSGTGGPGSAGAPGKVLTDLLAAKLDLLSNLDFAHTNGSVNGHTLADSIGDYAAAKTAAGGVPIVVPLIFGMNEGGGGGYYGGLTLPGIRSALTALVGAIRADGADPIVYTTPHPNTALYDFSYGGPYTYPGSFLPNAAASKVSADWAQTGTAFNQWYRHYRVNQALRAVAAELGVLVADAERYWFDAVAAQGEAALFTGAETVHPNTLGHQLSYGRASAAIVGAMTRSVTNANVVGSKRLSAPGVAVNALGTVVATLPPRTTGIFKAMGEFGGANETVVVCSCIVLADEAAVSSDKMTANSTVFGPIIGSVVGSAVAPQVTITAVDPGANGIVISWVYEYTDF